MSLIQLKNINKHFDGNHILKNINLEIEEGDFMTFLGPSGCGKTTTLRVIAGLEEPESGRIFIDETLAVDGEKHYYTPPAKRGLNLVFQNYALWPHMSVYENVAFGLKLQKLPKAEVKEKVEKALRKLHIDTYKDRYPSELSGGQQQRVAIARAIVTEPKILLLDEPLSNLDAKLRIEMRTELKRLHRELNTTIIYVTHDQVEALTLSTKIAVFFDGELMQVDTPRNLYRYPAHTKVADFIGNPTINFIRGTYIQEQGHSYISSDLGRFPLLLREKPRSKDILLTLKPEDVILSTHPSQKGIPFTVFSILPAGSETLIQLKRGELYLMAKEIGEVEYEVDETVWVDVPQEKLNVYDTQSGELISETSIKSYISKII